MNSFKRVFYLMAFSLLGSVVQPTAGQQLFFRICPKDILVVEPRLTPVIVGCEVVDCCPGCPGPVLIDWHIRFRGRPIEAMLLRFENLPPAAARKLKLEGNARWLKENILQLGEGETRITGFALEANTPLPAAFPQVALDSTAIAKLEIAMLQDSLRQTEDAGRVQLDIEQFSGAVVVNEYALTYLLTPCPDVSIGLNDRIDLDNNIGADNAAVFVDGRRTACINDELRRGSNIIGVGNLRTRNTCNSEVAVFSDDNAMELVTPVTIWTNAVGDLLRVNLAPLLRAPVTVRLLLPGARPRAAGDIANANLLYNTNHAGVAFDAEIQNLSNNNAAINLIGTNAGAMCAAAWRTAVQSSAFFTPGRLNVYYVNGAFTGLTCIANPNIIVIGTTANNQTLAQEIGHAFSLDHTNSVAGFGSNNVMVGGGAGRNHFSEGQAFRMNVNAASMLNVNGVRTGPTRNCPDGTSSFNCFPLALDAVPN